MDNTVKEPLIHLSKREDMSFGKKPAKKSQ